MTRVDFHFNAPDKIAYGCRLVRKAYRAKHPVLVWCDDESRLDAFDRLLWSDSPTDFVPHVRADSALAPRTPILLAHETADTDAHDVLVNLGRITPPMFARFERLIEIVGTDEDDRIAARERWRFYRDRGYPMTRHDVGGTSG